MQVPNFSPVGVNNWEKFTIEFWVKLKDGVSVTNGVGLAYPNWQGYWGFSEGGAIAYASLWDGTHLWINGTTWVNTDPNFNIPSGVWTHVAIVVNKNGIEGTSDTMRAYINGVLAGSSLQTFAGITSPVTLQIVGNPINTGACLGAMDNFKIWDYAKTDFSDRFTEGFGPSVTVISPNGGETWEVNSLHNITWSATSDSGIAI